MQLLATYMVITSCKLDLCNTYNTSLSVAQPEFLNWQGMIRTLEGCLTVLLEYINLFHFSLAEYSQHLGVPNPARSAFGDTLDHYNHFTYQNHELSVNKQEEAKALDKKIKHNNTLRAHGNKVRIYSNADVYIASNQG